MIVTLYEIDATGMKAAKGAGMPWGLAEEAGKAVRWLAAWNLPGVELLAEILTRNHERPIPDLAPLQPDQDLWQAREGFLGPVLCGAALSDLAGEIAAGRSPQLEGVSCPAFLVPFMAHAARELETSFVLEWPGMQVFCRPDGVFVQGFGNALVLYEAVTVTCHAGDADCATELVPAIEAQEVDDAAWQVLLNFAHRTYAPATEESRLAGAGAGLSDND